MDTLDDALAPIGSHRCDRCCQQARARLDTAKGPLEAFHTAYEEGPRG